MIPWFGSLQSGKPAVLENLPAGEHHRQGLQGFGLAGILLVSSKPTIDCGENFRASARSLAMQSIQSVVIYGAGALGAFYASKFLDAGEFAVSVAASGERGRLLEQQGLTVNGRHFPVAVIDPYQQPEPADLLLVALKHHQLAAALPELCRLTGRKTLVLSVMNGLDSEEMIQAACGTRPLLYCIAVGIDGVRQAGEVVVANAGRLIFGTALNDPPGPAVRRLQSALDRAGLAWETPTDMLRMLWWKFMVNVGINQASAVLGAPYGTFQQSADACRVANDLMREVIALAGPAGINLGEDDLAAWSQVLNRLAPAGKTSMLQDIEAGRQTEVAIFGGKVVELGERYGVATPGNRMMLHLIRVLEKTAN
ncbi:MAG TPA: 2-dehydropantoate 2-reductase [Desulfuromonadales bacterium]|nr:2-dehydropantoate 2-reductase [Desulfuromonadales bacterium]